MILDYPVQPVGRKTPRIRGRRLAMVKERLATGQPVSRADFPEIPSAGELLRRLAAQGFAHCIRLGGPGGHSNPNIYVRA